jgi:meso-butanediol dehydrogenase / (S,S)-butanediol dehydrogenase / diacetyl reductase
MSFTRSLTLEYGSRGVKVNAVALSLTSTDATAELMKSDALMAAFRARIPVG